MKAWNIEGVVCGIWSREEAEPDSVHLLLTCLDISSWDKQGFPYQIVRKRREDSLLCSCEVLFQGYSVKHMFSFKRRVNSQSGWWLSTSEIWWLCQFAAFPLCLLPWALLCWKCSKPSSRCTDLGQKLHSVACGGTATVNVSPLLEAMRGTSSTCFSILSHPCVCQRSCQSKVVKSCGGLAKIGTQRRAKDAILPWEDFDN